MELQEPLSPYIEFENVHKFDSCLWLISVKVLVCPSQKNFCGSIVPWEQQVHGLDRFLENPS